MTGKWINPNNFCYKYLPVLGKNWPCRCFGKRKTRSDVHGVAAGGDVAPQWQVELDIPAIEGKKFENWSGVARSAVWATPKRGREALEVPVGAGFTPHPQNSKGRGRHHNDVENCFLCARARACVCVCVPYVAGIFLSFVTKVKIVNKRKVMPTWCPRCLQ